MIQASVLLPDAFDGFTLTQLSDVHSGSFTSRKGVEKGLELVNEQNSDMLPGDTRYQDHAEPNAEYGQCTPQVWLQKDEHEHNQRVRTGNEDVTVMFYFHVPTAEIFC